MNGQTGNRDGLVQTGRQKDRQAGKVADRQAAIGRARQRYRQAD